MAQSRRITDCRHKDTISTTNAGLERVVCEKCGYVSVRFIESTVRIHPTLEPLMAERSDPIPEGCGWCSEPVEFMIPGGLACELHAWKEASKHQIMGSDPWIPISIDRTNAP